MPGILKNNLLAAARIDSFTGCHPDLLESALSVGGHTFNVLHVGSHSIAGSNARRRAATARQGALQGYSA
jgi:hypothetical protein